MKIDSIYIACYKHDVRFTRILVASIRIWYQEIPIILIKDYRYGAFDTADLEKYFGVSIFNATPRLFGWGFGKLEPLFLDEKKRSLILDSDIVMVGPVLDMLEKQSADFVVTYEQPGAEFVDRLYFDVTALEAFDPTFKFAGFTFNTGQLVATSGLLKRSDFDEFVDWNEPPSVKNADIFRCGEQGLLNYILLKKQALGQISLEKIPMMIVADSPLCDQISLLDLQANTAHRTLIHWCGLLRDPISPQLNNMYARHILLYFETLYYAKIPFGRIRSKVGLSMAAAHAAIIARIKKIDVVRKLWNRLTKRL